MPSPGFPSSKGQGSPGKNPVENHKDDKGPGVSHIRGKAKYHGSIQPEGGSDKCL